MQSKQMDQDKQRVPRLMASLLAAGSIFAFECIGWNAGSIAYAVVPPSLAQRPQEASVEAILQAMEAKAVAAGDGTWTLGSGSQDQPAVSYASGFAGGRWYLKRTDGQAEYLLFSDGSEFFELPDRVTYTLYTADKGERQDYGLGHYLLHVNLRPRQFLGPKGLENLGEVMWEQQKYIHLRARVLQDAAVQADPPARVWESQLPAQLDSIDYYYDPARHAIGGMSLNFVDGSKAQSLVSGWDKFGTQLEWPRTIIGKRIRIAPGEPQSESVLTSVQGFTPGADGDLAGIGARVSSVPFFSGVPEELRRPTVYAQALEADPENLTVQVLLTQAYFRSEQPKQGLAQWEDLRQKISDPDQQKQLTTMLVEPAGLSLSHAAITHPDQAAACVELAKRLTSQEMSDAQWKRVSRPVVFAWAFNRAHSRFTDQLEPLDDLIISRVAHQGSHQAMWAMIEFAAKRSAALAAKVDPALVAAAAEPLPLQGYSGTQQSALITMCARAGYTDRAIRYIDGLRWHPDSTAQAKAAVVMMRSMLAQLSQPPRSAEEAGQLVDRYDAAVDPGLVADDRTRQACRVLAARVGVAAMRAAGSEQADPQLATPTQLVVATAAKPSAAQYWHAVVEEVLATREFATDDERQVLIRATGEVAAACGEHFQMPEYASQVWLRIGNSQLLDPRIRSPLERVGYFNKAFAGATLDTTKLEAMKAIVGVFQGIGKHDQAAEILDGLRTGLTDASSQTVVDGLLKKISDDKAQYALNAAERERTLTLDRLMGQVAHLRARLTEAEREGRPPVELDSLRRVLEQSEQEAAAMQTAP